MNSKALFGGALLAAGMTANAQTFSFLDSGSYGGTAFGSFAQVYAGYYTASPYSYGFTDYNAAYSAYGDDLNISTFSAAGGTTTSTTRNSTTLRFESTWDGVTNDGGFFGGTFQQFFTVDQDATLQLSWDMSNTDFFGPPGFFTIFSGGALISDLDVTAANPTGTFDIALTAGTEYGIVLVGGSPFSFDGGTKFLQAELLPAPGTAALMGLGGLAATRRRR